MAAVAAPPALNSGDPMLVDVAPAVAEAPSEPPSETLYIQNLNEKIRPDVMKQTLRALFKNYGEVLDVVAHRNLRMRGQAFVSFPDKEVAAKALREVKGFPLYSKPMVSFFFTIDKMNPLNRDDVASVICTHTV